MQRSAFHNDWQGRLRDRWFGVRDWWYNRRTFALWPPPWWAWLLLASGLALTGAAVAFGIAYQRQDVPDLEALRAGAHPDLGQATIVYTADGKELTRFFRDDRIWIPYAAISPHVVDALIATEDHRFYGHYGVDLLRLASSTWKSLLGDTQGGSTITMQLARNFYADIGQTSKYRRKLREIVAALKFERHYDKQQIVELYLNTVPFNYNAFGIEAAARTYFARSAAQLTVAEAATLIGMLKATTRYNPVRNPDLAQQRRNVVLSQMVKRGTLDEPAYTHLRAQPVQVRFRRETIASSMAPHFAEFVRTWVADWAATQGYDPYEDGLRVHTTLDSGLQALAQEAVAAQMAGLQAVAGYEWSRPVVTLLGGETDPYLKKHREGAFTPFAHFARARAALLDEHLRRTLRYRKEAALRSDTAAVALLKGDAAFMDSLRAEVTRLEAGLVALDPQSGHVRAWVGGTDFEKDQYDHVAIARRQPGSTFKPFVYAAALETGFEPGSRVRDAVQTYRVKGTSRTWRPGDMGGASGDTLALREGLIYSKNTITAYLMAEVGPEYVAHLARRMGIVSPLDEVPALALGTSDVTLLELVAAYSPFVLGGTYHAPVVVTHIDDRSGRRLATFAGEPREVLPRYTAFEVLDMMRDVIDQGTGVRIRNQFGIRADVAGKTGTTQNNADGWFILMHPELVTGAWVGFNDRRLTFRSSYWGQGAHNALFLVGDFFRHALDAGLVAPGATFRTPYRRPQRRLAYEDDPSADAARQTLAGDSVTVAHDAPLTTMNRDAERTMRAAVARDLAREAPRADSSRSPDRRRSEGDAEATMRRMLEEVMPPDSSGTRPH